MSGNWIVPRKPSVTNLPPLRITGVSAGGAPARGLSHVVLVTVRTVVGITARWTLPFSAASSCVRLQAGDGALGGSLRAGGDADYDAERDRGYPWKRAGDTQGYRGLVGRRQSYGHDHD